MPTATAEKIRPLDPTEKLRFKAEASKFDAEARLFDAQVAEANTRAQIALQELEQFRLNTRMGEIQVDEQERRERSLLAADAHNHVYVFNAAVTPESVRKCIDVLTTWHRNDAKCAIELQINSPGGEILEGFALIDFLLDLRNKGHNLTTVAIGRAASMGALFFQVGEKRVMGEFSMLLLHKGSLQASGDFDGVEDMVALMSMFHDKMLTLLTSRAKVDREFITDRWNRKDWWLNAEKALEYGFCDEVRALIPSE